MYATEDRPMTGGVHLRCEPVTPEHVIDLLARRRDADPNGCGRMYWVSRIMDVSSYCEMPMIVAMEWMQFVATNNCVGLKRNRDYLIRSIEDAIEEPA